MPISAPASCTSRSSALIVSRPPAPVGESKRADAAPRVANAPVADGAEDPARVAVRPAEPAVRQSVSAMLSGSVQTSDGLPVAGARVVLVAAHQGRGRQTTAAELVDSEVVGDAKEPGGETVARVEAFKRAPGADEGLLGQVAGELDVAHQLGEEARQPPLVAADQRGKGLSIAVFHLLVHLVDAHAADAVVDRVLEQQTTDGLVALGVVGPPL